MDLPIIPAKDCANCVYRQESMRDGGHCYVYRNEPAGDLCGSFRSWPQQRLKEMIDLDLLVGPRVNDGRGRR